MYTTLNLIPKEIFSALNSAAWVFMNTTGSLCVYASKKEKQEVFTRRIAGDKSAHVHAACVIQERLICFQ